MHQLGFIYKIIQRCTVNKIYKKELMNLRVSKNVRNFFITSSAGIFSVMTPLQRPANTEGLQCKSH